MRGPICHHCKSRNLESCYIILFLLRKDGDDANWLFQVMDYYKSGELQSLTMVDLKCFLTSKKAKVGGKKEELIKRVTSLLA